MLRQLTLAGLVIGLVIAAADYRLLGKTRQYLTLEQAALHQALEQRVVERMDPLLRRYWRGLELRPGQDPDEIAVLARWAWMDGDEREAAGFEMLVDYKAFELQQQVQLHRPCLREVHVLSSPPGGLAPEQFIQYLHVDVPLGPPHSQPPLAGWRPTVVDRVAMESGKVTFRTGFSAYAHQVHLAPNGVWDPLDPSCRPL